MTLSDLQIPSSVTSFINVIFRTPVQQLTRFELAARSAVSVAAELLAQVLSSS